MQASALKYKFNLHDPIKSQTFTNHASLKANFDGKEFGMFIETHRTELTDEEYDSFKNTFITEALKELSHANE